MQMHVPDVPMSLPDFVPIVHGLAQLLVQAAEREARAAGRSVSCGPGCGACCRQLVPIAPAEAIVLRRVIAQLDADQRTRVEYRFAAARKRLRSLGIDTRLRNESGKKEPESRRALGLEYFALGIACPFLEDESCSIHDQRPLACREYMVTSDPSVCSHPEFGTVETVEMPRRLSQVFRWFAGGYSPQHSAWVPLILALDDAVVDPEGMEGLRVPGPMLLERFFQALAPACAGADSAETAFGALTE